MKRIIIEIGIVVVFVGALFIGGYRWHSSAMANQASAYEQRQKEFVDAVEAQDNKIAELLLDLMQKPNAVKIEPYNGGKAIRLMDGSKLYYDAKLGSKDITVEFAVRANSTIPR